MTFYVGEVRNIKPKGSKKGGPGGGDPTFSGAVRVQLYNLENDLNEDELKLASVMQPITSAATAGVGSFPFGPVEGTRVVCTYSPWDTAKQYPIVIGTLGRGDLPSVGGVNNQPDKDTGGEIKHIAPDVPGANPPFKIVSDTEAEWVKEGFAPYHSKKVQKALV